MVPPMRQIWFSTLISTLKVQYLNYFRLYFATYNSIYCWFEIIALIFYCRSHNPTIINWTKWSQNMRDLQTNGFPNILDVIKLFRRNPHFFRFFELLLLVVISLKPEEIDLRIRITLEESLLSRGKPRLSRFPLTFLLCPTVPTFTTVPANRPIHPFWKQDISSTYLSKPPSVL